MLRRVGSQFSIFTCEIRAVIRSYQHLNERLSALSNLRKRTGDLAIWKNKHMSTLPFSFAGIFSHSIVHFSPLSLPRKYIKTTFIKFKFSFRTVIKLSELK